MTFHLHLDCLGGLAGDMFLAAMIDVRPDCRQTIADAIAAMDGPEKLGFAAEPHDDGVFAGHRFKVGGVSDGGHRSYGQIRQILAASRLPDPVRARAEDMFRRLAEAEARVHGKDVEQVHFHELSGWDSVVDVVGAAAVIETLGVTGCSVSDLPLGGGRVNSAHGPLPVPAPATILLLDGLRLVDDGVRGERVTPTGAAILRHLDARQDGTGVTGVIAGQGYGFGTRSLQGISNAVRVLLLKADTVTEGDRVGLIAFEVDDQSGEELALGLERLRAVPEVLDVLQSPAFGKKGRLTVQVQVLCGPESCATVAEACLSQTATLGVRVQVVARLTAPRCTVAMPVDGAVVRVKRARRPDGAHTAKAESADLDSLGPDLARRQHLRRAAEARALAEDGTGDDG